MLTVARRQAGSVQPLAVGPLVGELKDLLAHTLPKDIRLEVVVAAHLPRVRAERSLLTTALLNLALNARDAMPMGGTLAVRAVPHTDGEGREWVELAVADSGVGIPEGVRDLIFQPFYTTKDVGKGTGLGLSTAYAAVEGWGGKLAVSSTEGRGSTFTIRLPAADGEAAARPTPGEDTEVAHPLSRAPVLVVEDEEDVARLMTHALESRGYGVSRVGTGLQALERLREGPEDLGLVVLDLILPEWGGEGVYRMLRGLAPEVPVLLVSGREDLAEALAPQGPRLTKPFTAAEFLGAVAAALSGKERAS
jgi:CheY-like chemotaxis protein